MSEIFQYIVIFSLAVWTARLAITKGRNGWTWGAAALILGLLPWHLIGVIPVLALMFMKAPVGSNPAQTGLLACARCSKPHSDSQHFCTGCGWDLNQTDPPESIENEQAPIDPPRTPTTIHSTTVARVPEDAEPSDPDPEAVSAPQSATGHDEAFPDNPETVSQVSEEDYVPWGTYDVGEAPTAAVMVSRGIERFGEGKFQEAIDQFTKAIALDPQYADAWERRSEAYTQLGRSQQAEDDRRHLQGLGPSSSLS